MECHSAIKENEILPFVTIWVDLECIMLSEVSQKEKDTDCMTSLICGMQKVKQTSEYYKQRNRLINIKNKLIFTSWGGNGWAQDRGR